ncbi:MAG: hypothetical protein IKP22_07230 [Clostridia bacterium]|nr:hypothetical protein [Clostridia bacterium]
MKKQTGRRNALFPVLILCAALCLALCLGSAATAQSTDIQFYASTAQVETATDFTITAVVPGAERLAIYPGDNREDIWASANGFELEHILSIHTEGLWTFHLLQWVDDEWQDVDAAPVDIQVNAPNGSLEGTVFPNGLETPEIQPGDSFTFTFSGIDHATQYSYFVYDQENWQNIAEGETQPNVPVTLEPSLFEAGHVYKVEAMVNSPGYNSLWDGRFFMVNVDDAQNIDDPGSSLTMRLNRTQVSTFEDFSCTFFAPGANAVEVYLNEDMVYHIDGEGGRFVRSWRYPQDICLSACALYGDDNWTDRTNCQALISVTNENGDLPIPDVALSSNRINMGDTVTATFGETPNATYYSFYYFNINETYYNGIRGDDSDTPRAITLDTDGVPSGVYRTVYDVDAVGYTEGHGEDTLMIVDPGDEDHSTSRIDFTVSSSHIDTFTDIHIMVSAPGAVGYRMYENDNLTWESGWGFDIWRSYRYPGDYTLSVSVSYGDDIWTDREECQVTISAASVDDLPVPDVTLSSNRINLGDTVTATFGETPNATYYSFYYFNINKTYADGIKYGDSPTPCAITLDTDDVPSGVYRTVYDVDAIGYTEGHGEDTLMIVDPNDEDHSTNRIDFTVSSSNISTFQGFHVMVSAPGADDFRMYENDVLAWESPWGFDFWHEYRHPGDNTLSVSVHFPDEGWTNRTDCQVTISAAGDTQLDEPTVNIDQIISFGDTLEIEFEETENATHYSYWIAPFNDPNGGIKDGMREGAGSLFVDTGDLGTGLFIVYLDVNATGCIEGHTQRYLIVVNDSDHILTDNSGNILVYSADQVATNEPVRFILVAPGAGQVEVRENDHLELSGWEAIDGWLTWGYADEVLMHAAADFNGGLQEIDGLSFTMHISSEHSFDLSGLVPSTLLPGEDFVIERPDGAQHVEFHLYHQETGDYIFDYEWDENYHDEDDPGNVTVPSDLLETNHCYRVEYKVNAYNYEDASISEEYFTVADVDQNVQISVNGSQDTYISLLRYEPYTVAVSAPGASAVRAFDGWGWHYAPGNQYTDTWRDGATGTRPIYAQACYGDDISWDGVNMDEFDWENSGFVWGGLSEVITMHYYTTDDAPDPVVELSDTSVVYGDAITFTVVNADQFDGFSWAVTDQDDQFPPENAWWRYWEGESTITFNSNEYAAWEGNTTFYLWVNAHGSLGKNDSWACVEYTVTGQDGPMIQIDPLPAEVERGDILAIRILNPEISSEFYAWFYDLDSDEQHEFFFWDGEETIFLPTYDIPAGHNCHLYVKYRGSNGIFDTSIRLDIRVVEPYDPSGYKPVFYMSTDQYTIGRGGTMRGYAMINEATPLDSFLLELIDPNGGQWTESWDLYNNPYGWDDNSDHQFPWGTETAGEWSLRVAIRNSRGQRMTDWSDWWYFTAFEEDYDQRPVFRLTDGMETVETEAFAEISAQRVIIPQGVFSIEARAFADNWDLRYVEFEGEGPLNIDGSAFENCPGVIIYAWYGSPSWNYAITHGIGCIAW